MASVPPVVVPTPGSVPTPPSGAVIAAFTVDLLQWLGGDTAVASISLVTPAPAGGTLVTLTSSDRDVRPPASISIPEGATLGMFQIASSAPHADTSVRVTAVVNGETRTLEIVLLLPRPGAHGDRYQARQDETLVVRAPGVLDNDVRRQGHDLIAVLAASALHGEVTLNADGGFSYRPAPGFTGEDRFIYRPVDGVVSGDQGTVVIAVGLPAGTTPVGAATLAVTGTPLLLASGGGARTITVTNNSSTTATNVVSSLAGTALAGNASETGNTCASVAPGASCTLSFTGTSVVAATTFAIRGSNTNSVNAAIEVANIAIGAAFRGGIIFQINGDGVSGTIAATADNDAGITWGPSTITNGQSDTDGPANTATVVAAVGNNAGVPYAAQICDALSVNSGGVTYNDWYLPAKNELNELYDNRIAVGGFTAGIYWSSTEFTGSPIGDAWAQVFGTGLQGFSGKINTNVVRCVRVF